MNPLQSVKCELDSHGIGSYYPVEMKLDVHDGILPCTFAGEKGSSYNHIIDSNIIDFDTEYFLNEMEKRTAIWDSRTKIYLNRVAKTKAWEELLDIFIPKFQDMDITKKRTAAADLQKRWRSLRGSYIRDIRNKKAGKKYKDYKYFQQLSFLKPVIENKTQNDGDTEVPVVERNTNIRNKNAKKKFKLSPLQLVSKKKTQLVEFTKEINNYSQDEKVDKKQSPQICSSPNDKSKKQSFNIEDQKLSKTATKHIGEKTKETPEVEDADRYYLLSLLPHYKSLTQDAKLEFQMDVLKSLKKWKNQYTLSETHYTPDPTVPTSNPHTITNSNGVSSTESHQVFHPIIYNSNTNPRSSGSEGSLNVTQFQPLEHDSDSSESAEASQAKSPMSNTSIVYDELYPDE